jgi:GT2 family glycosyltransferase
VDLAEGIPALEAEPGVASVLVVYWWGGLPLGSHELAADELPLPAAALAPIALRAIAPAIGEGVLPHGFRATLPVCGARMPEDTAPDARTLIGLAAPLAAFVRRQQAAAAVAQRLSLVICTRDRPVELARCLESVFAGSVPFGEVVAVDNAPTTDATREVVARFPDAVYVREPRPGLSVARNAGVRATTGEIVAFTDDDAIVHRDWAARLALAFGEPRIMAVTGLVLPAALDSDAQVAFEQEIGGFGRGFRPLVFDAAFLARMRGHGAPVWRIGAGANMALRREAFAHVGFFDERLGAGAAGCSEDSEMWYRLLAAGHSCRYEPTAVVHHFHRGDWDGLSRQMRAYMKGHVVALFVQYWRHGHAGNLRRIFVTLPRIYASVVGRGMWRGFGVRGRLVAAEIAGCVAGIAASVRLRVTGRHRQ